MKTTNLYSFLLLGVMLLGAITGCGKDSPGDLPVEEVIISPDPTAPDMVFVQTGNSYLGESFYIGKFPVTQAQWTAVMGTTVEEIAKSDCFGTRLAGVGDNYPMYYVSWDDAREYIAKLNALTGKNYRLPTSEEWEYAARGGNQSKKYKYSGSDDIDEVAWYYCNIPNRGVQPVGRKKPNELDIYDMSGNVWEWCSDCDSRAVDAFCNSRVVRGGAWDCNVGGAIVRNNVSTAYYKYIGNSHGFRLALSVE